MFDSRSISTLLVTYELTLGKQKVLADQAVDVFDRSQLVQVIVFLPVGLIFPREMFLKSAYFLC
jgi:hypothetical protein